MARTVFKGTVLSILIFFSLSFLTFLTGISPIDNSVPDPYKLEIGYPVTYYSQEWISADSTAFLRHNWQVKNLLLSCLGYWLVVAGSYLFYQQYQNKKARERRKRRKMRRSSSQAPPVSLAS